MWTEVFQDRAFSIDLQDLQREYHLNTRPKDHYESSLLFLSRDHWTIRSRQNFTTRQTSPIEWLVDPCSCVSFSKVISAHESKVFFKSITLFMTPEISTTSKKSQKMIETSVLGMIIFVKHSNMPFTKHFSVITTLLERFWHQFFIKRNTTRLYMVFIMQLYNIATSD